MNTRNPIALLFGWIAFSLLPSDAVEAAEPRGSNRETGVIEGRVYNPATGEYLRNAEVRVQGTGILEVTAADGRYRLSNVPAGQATVTVSFTGFQPAAATVVVTPAATVTHNFDLQSTAQPDSNAVIRLGQFTVTGEREGTAKAIMEQRNSMNIKNVVASDTFSIMTEGNIGEVLQYLPGIPGVHNQTLIQGSVWSVGLKGRF